MAKTTVHKIRVTLSQIMVAAIADGLIAVNPVTGTSIKGRAARSDNYLTPEQRLLLLDLIAGSAAYPLVFTLLYTGLRLGEALALTKKNVDLDQKIIRITQSVEFNGVTPQFKPPKTASGVRTVPIPPVAIEVLKQHMDSTKGLYVFPGIGSRMHTRTSIDNLLTRKIQAPVDRYFKAERKMALDN